MPVIMSYLVSIMGFFGVSWPVVLRSLHPAVCAILGESVLLRKVQNNQAARDSK